MLQKEFRTFIATILQENNPTVTIRVGAGAADPTDLDNGLKGAELATVTVDSEQSNQAFIAKTVTALLISAGIAQEVVFENPDGICMDRMLITPLTGGPNMKVLIEYQLESLS